MEPVRGSARGPEGKVTGVEVPGGTLAVELITSAGELTLVTVRPMAGVDHAGSIMTPAGAGTAAKLTAEALA
jgi:hypothetical protein